MKSDKDDRRTVPPIGRVSRRDFLRSTAAVAATVAVGAGPVQRVFAQAPLPEPGASGIDHIVVVMMENRSFDHYLGWLDGADGQQAGLRFVDNAGVTHRTHRLAPDFQGCAHPDPDHSFQGGRIAFNGGACDGWLKAGENDAYAIGYYTKKDLSFWGNAAPRWTTCDRYFPSIMAETFPNRIYQHCAQTDRLFNTANLCDLPTIWDRLEEAGVEGRYYFSDVPMLALWGTKYIPISRSIAQFYADAQAGTLPPVAFVEPRFLGQSLGISNDDHPHADIRDGQAFVDAIYRAVTTGPSWSRTTLVINYDEWGGFFDHVSPPLVTTVPAEEQVLGNDGRLGFRVPCLIVSPFARREHVAHGVFEHVSVLRMIEWRWGLQPLTTRDANANNLADALDFTAPSVTAKQFSVPPGPFGTPCGGLPLPDKWDNLLAMALSFGWPV